MLLNPFFLHAPAQLYFPIRRGSTVVFSDYQESWSAFLGVRSSVSVAFYNVDLISWRRYLY